MSLAQRFERRLEGAVGSAFARVFKGQVEPVEIGNALQREASDKHAVMGSGAVLAPNRYRVSLGESDFDRLAPWEVQLCNSLAELVQEFLDEQRWNTVGDVEVILHLDPTLHTGVFGVASRMEPAAPPRQRPYESLSLPFVAGAPAGQYERPYAEPAAPPSPAVAPAGAPFSGLEEPYERAAPVYSDSAQPVGQDAATPVPGGGSDAPVPGDPYDRGGSPGVGRDPWAAAAGAVGAGAAAAGIAGAGAAASGMAASGAAGAGAAPLAYGQDPYAQPQYAQPDYAQPQYAEPQYAQPGPPPADHGPVDYGPPPGYSPPPYVEPRAARRVRGVLAIDGSATHLVLRRGSNVIGRSHDADLQILDQGVSRRHVDVQFDGEFAVVYDLGSTNGTSVNGHQVGSHQLQHGDVVRVGHTRIVYHQENG